jgi:glycosyltransferase involved in cell wall biosynthesis
MPAVSVITPAYNAAPFIAETLDSVRGQTLDDWELVIVDDGSTDGTTDLIADYQERDGRIRLLHQANAGPSSARNHAMRAARGAFFAFLDSDDTWEPQYLERQLAVFREYPDTHLVTGVARYRGGPRDGRPMRPFASGYPVLALRDIIEDDTAVFIMTLFRREVFDTIGGLDESQWRSEDYDFWLRAAVSGFVFRRNPQPLGRYRVREGSLSQNTVDMLRGILQTYDKVRPACPPGSAERAVLDVQTSRFERELLLAEAKLALERRAFADAARHLRTLQTRGGGPLVALTAWLAEHAPLVALLAYRMRHLRQYARAGGERARRATASEVVPS